MAQKERITVQDIAASLGLSRNTVSKVLNGQYVPPRTRERVLAAAIEMGYKSYGTVATSEPRSSHKRIVLITSKHLMTMTFFLHLVRGIEFMLQELDNIELLQFTTSTTSFFNRLVDYLDENEVDGIICMELFYADYVPRLIELGYPTVFFDFPIYLSVSGNYDVVLPESFCAVKNACLSLIRDRGIRSFGFVGDYTHCTSFYERFLGMREALFFAGIPYDENDSFIEKDSFPYGNTAELAKALSGHVPACYICANDTIAISVIKALSLLHKKVPDDVLVLGFDNLPEGKNFTPPLSTFNVDKSSLGKTMLTTLLNRIDQPHQKTRTIYLQTKQIHRQTT